MALNRSFSRRAVRRLSPTKAHQLVARGIRAQQQGQTAAALALYRLVLGVYPTHPQALYFAGLCAYQLGETPRAIQFLTASLQSAPDHADGWFSLGKLHQDTGNDGRALQCYLAALEHDDGHVPALNCAGNLFLAAGDRRGARYCWSRALAQVPGSAEATYNRAYLKLLQGDLVGGFADYESRWLCPSFFVEYGRQDVAAVPMWTGQPVGGRTLYVHAEQGFGDVIQMLRYVPRLRALGARVVLELQPALHRLAALTFGADDGVTVVTKTDEALTPEAIHYHAPMMSLPHRFGAEIPAEVPYLLGGDEVFVHKTSAVGKSDAGITDLRVGIVWAGSTTHPNDHNRSCPVEALAPLWDVPGIQWVSLQVGARAGEAPDHLARMEPEPSDFADTASLVRELDLVIAVDTSTAHLAGALGVPVWILLPTCPDWRWQLDREDSPWYPTARLVRRAPDEEWPALIARVATDLGRLRT